jgi:error-prone DNA polymerase
VSFALLVYVSSWLKCYYPDIFASALLNSMPMGFYQPAQIIIDAQKHGVEVRSVDVNYSEWDNKLEERSGKYWAIRLGFRQVNGMRQDDSHTLTSARKKGYHSVNDLRVAGITEAVLEKLADADAFRSMNLDRRNALWKVSTNDHQKESLYTGKYSEDAREEKIDLPAMSLSEHVVHDYTSMALSLKAHPVSFLRKQLDQLRVYTTSSLATAKEGTTLKVAGLILVRQRPGTASGICFITLEDETGTANLVVFHQLFDKYRKEIIQSRLLMVEGKLQREGEVIHVIVSRCFNISTLLQRLVPSGTENPTLGNRSRSDETTSPGQDTRDKTQTSFQTNIFPEGRNFR